MKEARSTRFIVILTGCIISVLLFQKSQAQNPDNDIRIVVDRLFDGMRKGDSTMVRSVFLKDNALNSVSKNTNDSTIIRSEGNVEGFIKAVGTPHQEKWDERIYNLIIHTDGPMAIVWAPYKFYRGETFSHCGVNVFTLIKVSAEWKIREITDTRRKTDCP